MQITLLILVVDVIQLLLVLRKRQIIFRLKVLVVIVIRKILLLISPIMSPSPTAVIVSIVPTIIPWGNRPRAVATAAACPPLLLQPFLLLVHSRDPCSSIQGVNKIAP